MSRENTMQLFSKTKTYFWNHSPFVHLDQNMKGSINYCAYSPLGSSALNQLGVTNHTEELEGKSLLSSRNASSQLQEGLT